MPHTHLLGVHIVLIELIRLNLNGDILYNFKAIGLKTYTLDRVVGHELHPVNSQFLKDRRAYAIIALVRVKTEVHIGIDGIKALLLKLICLNLCHETNASALLIEINDHAFALLINSLHGLVQLLTALTALRAEDVASHTRRVDTHQNGFISLPLSLDEGYVFLAVALLTEGDEAEIAILGGEVDLTAARDKSLSLKAIGNQILNRDEPHAVLLGNLTQLWEASHGTILIHNLNEGGGGLQTCKAGKVNGGLGVTGTSYDTPVLSIEGVDMSRATEVCRLACRVGQRLDGGSAVVDGYASGAALKEVDRHSERRAEN